MGPEGRKLFERFLRGVNELQARLSQAQAQIGRSALKLLAAEGAVEPTAMNVSSAPSLKAVLRKTLSITANAWALSSGLEQAPDYSGLSGRLGHLEREQAREPSRRRREGRQGHVDRGRDRAQEPRSGRLRR